MHYPAIDPVIFSLGPLAVRWYGLSYLLGFLACFYLGVWQTRHRFPAWSREQVSDLVFYGALGAVLGGRIGYALFYSGDQLLHNPLFIFKVWEGGMSFHGGVLGVMVAFWLLARKTSRTFFEVTDFIAPLAPIGLGLGRLGNFANTELPGRMTDSAFGLIYPCSADAIRSINMTCVGQWENFARHPSPLYQAFAEGLVLFLVLMLVARKPRAVGVISGWFLLGYGVLRMTTENFREPDAHIGFIVESVTMGQILSLPMAIVGILVIVWASRRGLRHPGTL